MITLANSDGGIAANAGDEEDAQAEALDDAKVEVNNLVDSHRLVVSSRASPQTCTHRLSTVGLFRSPMMAWTRRSSVSLSNLTSQS